MSATKSRSRMYPVTIVDTMDVSIHAVDQEAADWYKRSFPNKNGMTEETVTSQYGDVTKYFRNGIPVVVRFHPY